MAPQKAYTKTRAPVTTCVLPSNLLPLACTVPPPASQIFGFGVRRQNGRPRPPAAVRKGYKGWDDASSHSLDQLRWPWPPPKRSKLVHAAWRSQNLKFRQIWTRSRASADPDAPHGPGSNPKGYLGTDHTHSIPEQPEITRDCLISQNERVHKVSTHMGGRIVVRSWRRARAAPI